MYDVFVAAGVARFKAAGALRILKAAGVTQMYGFMAARVARKPPFLQASRADVMIYIGDGRRRLEMIGKGKILRQSIGSNHFAGGLD